MSLWSWVLRSLLLSLSLMIEVFEYVSGSTEWILYCCIWVDFSLLSLPLPDFCKILSAGEIMHTSSSGDCVLVTRQKEMGTVRTDT